ncbi:hypothetical protein NHF45_12835 [Maricaulaceae bacterium NA33B04]|nr:hypothetical protein [Maricaulaceae bacterium NA33B04]
MMTIETTVLVLGLLRSTCLPALLSAAPANDGFENSVIISGNSVFITGANYGADKEAGEPDHAQSGGASVWWSWTAPSDARVRITTEGSDFDTLLGVYIGETVEDLTTVRTNDDGNRVIVYSSVTFRPTADVTYHIAVDGVDGTEGNIQLNLMQYSD